MIQAASLERFVQLARAVARDDHVWRSVGSNRPDLWDRNREVGQYLEEIGLELLVRPVDLVDHEDGRLGPRVLERAQERPPDQKLLGEDVLRSRLLRLAPRLEQPDLEHLAGIVPLVDGGVDVEPLVTLQSDQL